jgi:hypothetical protein
MKLASTPVNELLFPDWRFVEEDLHNVSSRVQEYDAEAQLARDDVSGQLGLARRISNPDPTGTGSIWVIAKRLMDADDEPLVGEPDARVLEQQRASDAFRIQNMAAWHRTQEKVWEANERRRIQREIEKNMANAEEFVWTARRKDLHQAAPITVAKDVA